MIMDYIIIIYVSKPFLPGFGRKPFPAVDADTKKLCPAEAEHSL